MKKGILVLLLPLLFFACSKKNDTMPEGTYTEITPVPGRTTIVFSANKMTWTRKDNNDQETLYFKIKDNSIELAPLTNQGYFTTLSFKSAGKNSFEIGNLYPRVWIKPEVMNFKK